MTIITTVTSLYTAILALIYLGLTVRVLRMRGRLQIALNHGDDPALIRAIRVHANFAEYVPIGLLLLLLLEQQLAPAWIHACGITLVVGRLIHAYGVSQIQEDVRLRVTGMALTLTTLGATSITLLLLSSFTAIGNI